MKPKFRAWTEEGKVKTTIPVTLEDNEFEVEVRMK